MRLATASVGLVSPRSTCDSIGALTPLRSARSRRERSIASRRARTRGPIWIWCSIWSARAMASCVRYHVQTSDEWALATFGAMAHPIIVRPDVLVLAGRRDRRRGLDARRPGRHRGRRRLDFRSTEAFVGTSAGSIVAARLVAGRRPPTAAERLPRRRRPASPRRPRTAAAASLGGLVRGAARVGFAAAAPAGRAVALAVGAPAINLARAAVLARAAPHGRPLIDLSSASRAGARASTVACACAPSTAAAAGAWCSARPARRRPTSPGGLRLAARSRGSSPPCGSAGGSTSTAARGA